MPKPFERKLFTFPQPDGSQIQLLGWGNQFEAVFETLDGYTVARDLATGFFHYAELSADKSQLLPQGPRVTGSPPPINLPLHLRTTRTALRSRAVAARAADSAQRRWETRRQRRQTRAAAARDLAPGRAAAPAPAAAPAGDVVGLCLLVQFPDVPGTISQQQVDDFCNQVGYTGFGNNGSVRDYFLDVSDSHLSYRNVVTTYYTALHNRSYYTDPAIPIGTRARELILEGLTHLKNSGFNFDQLSSDTEGFIYALNVFYAGARVNVWNEGLWPHAAALVPFQATAATKFQDYQITDMGSELSIGTFCHENGHMVCDFPDLYDYGSESYGVGDYCLMCFGGPEKNPTRVCAYLRNEAGWTNTLTTLQPGTSYALGAAQNDFLIHRRSATEYFILENRRRTGRDAGLPDEGLAIWHVDELGSNRNEQMTDVQHYELSLEQADGRFDMEHKANLGDSDDLFGAPGLTRFGAVSAPNSTWWDGTASGLDIVSVSAPGPTITVVTGSGPTLAVNDFGYAASAGSWRTDMHLRFLADITGDGRADIVGFGNGGVYVSRANGDGSFSALQLVLASFGHNAGGWRVNKHPRLLADTNGDGRADIVGFGDDGVYVAHANANGTFGPAQRVVQEFGFSAGGWRTTMHPRFLADTSGDGRADIVGFGNNGVSVSRAKPDGSYGAVQLALTSFGYNAGWRVDKHPRFLADVTGDGRSDIVGFYDDGVYVSRTKNNGKFKDPKLALPNFGYNAGWRVDKHPRFLADITGDGLSDIVGFHDSGVYVARATGNGKFKAPQLVLSQFGYNAGGWRVDKHPRFLADTTGDGRADIVGFGDDGVYIARANGDGTFSAPQLVVGEFGYNAGGWRVDKHPRLLADTNGDGKADIVGFSDAGVLIFRL